VLERMAGELPALAELGDWIGPGTVGYSLWPYV
jgi:hypothetical protein